MSLSRTVNVSADHIFDGDPPSVSVSEHSSSDDSKLLVNDAGFFWAQVFFLPKPAQKTNYKTLHIFYVRMHIPFKLNGPYRGWNLGSITLNLTLEATSLHQFPLMPCWPTAIREYMYDVDLANESLTLISK